MIRFFKVCFVFLLPIFVMAACANAKALPVADLEHRRFVLASVDGVPFSASKTPDIAFTEDFRVSGQMCNRFMGQGLLDNGILKVSQMASTKMFCADAALNSVEDMFSSMLMAGSEAEFSGNILTLRQGGHVLVFTAADVTR